MKAKFIFLLFLLLFPNICLAQTPPPAVGVLTIESNSSRIGEIATEAICSNLGQMKSVYAVERAQLANVFSEQRLKYDGIVETLSSDSAQAIGLDYVLIGSATIQNTSFGSGGNYTNQRSVTLNLRLVDARVHIGRVVWSGQDTSTCFDKDGAEATNEAAYDCMRQLYEYIPVKGCVIKAAGHKCYIDIGTKAGAAKGDTLIIQGKGESIVHPETGEIINISDDSETVEIKEIHDDYCVVEIGDKRVSIGSPVTKKICSKPRDWLGVWSHRVDF